MRLRVFLPGALGLVASAGMTWWVITSPALPLAIAAVLPKDNGWPMIAGALALMACVAPAAYGLDLGIQLAGKRRLRSGPVVAGTVGGMVLAVVYGAAPAGIVMAGFVGMTLGLCSEASGRYCEDRH